MFFPYAGSFKESEEDPVVLHSVSAVGLKVLLESIYTSKLHLTIDSVQHVLPVAHLFQVCSAICIHYNLYMIKVIESVPSMCLYALSRTYSLLYL